MSAAAQLNRSLDQLLNPLRDILTADVARGIADLRTDAATQGRIDDLAERHHEGQLSEEEQQEYEALVGALSLIAVLQAKARSALNRRPQ